MKLVKVLVILLVAYVSVVVIFESLLGYYQPKGPGTLVITVQGDAGPRQRVVSRVDSGGALYVAANHWPRAWYNEVLEQPRVDVTENDTTQAYVAVPVSDDEHARVTADRPLGLVFRILTGFPPRRFVRLDPAPAGSAG